jgi:hypothetical protein
MGGYTAPKVHTVPGGQKPMQKTKVGGAGHREVKPTKRTKAHEINIKQAAPAEDSEPASTSDVPKFGQRLASNGTAWLGPTRSFPCADGRVALRRQGDA